MIDVFSIFVTNTNKEVTMKYILLLILGMMFIGCADNGMSASNENTIKKCDYTIHYYHPNVNEVIEKSGSFPDVMKDMYNYNDGWSLKDLYTRVIINDTTVYKDTLLTDVDLKELLNDSDLKASEADYVNSVLDETNTVKYLMNELEKRKGELLDVSCHEYNLITD